MNDLHMKRYRVYYFVGDFWSSRGETRKSMFVEATSEEDAYNFFKKLCPNYNFGWIEECSKSRK